MSLPLYSARFSPITFDPDQEGPVVDVVRGAVADEARLPVPASVRLSQRTITPR
jgi:hypothetical protein